MPRRFQDLPIRRKLTLVIVASVAAALVLASVGFLAFQTVSVSRVMVEKTSMQAEIIGYNSASAVIFRDSDAAETTLGALRADSHILAAGIYEPDGTLFASYVRDGRAIPALLSAAEPLATEPTERAAFTDGHLLVEHPIALDGEALGSVRLLSDLDALRDLLLGYAGIAVLVFVVALLAALPLIALLQRLIAGPIMHLVDQARVVSVEQNYAVRATRTGADELGLLVDAFNEMLGRIQERDGELDRARVAAETASRAKDEFLAVVSHELRTPLTPILAWARMLRTRTLDAPTTARAVEVIDRNARSQAQLIEDLLEVSRITAGKLRLDVARVAIAPVIEAAIDSVRPTAEVKGVRLTTVLDPHAGSVAGDAERLKQVVWNLLSNAIKFTPRGGRVQVVLRRVNSHIEISVSDTGAGISAAFLPYVFDRFRQADSTTTRPFGGLGLGLAIVRHLVELHGGQVRAESPGEGKGATFVVELPVSLIDEDPARVHPRVERLEIPGTPARRLDGLRILAVDDDADTLETVRVLLEQQGAEVHTAASAAAGLAEIDAWLPDLLISDVGMPEADGYEFIRELRRRPAARGGRVPALALTAYARVEDRLQALAAGYQMHVAKPIEPAELLAVVATLAEWVQTEPPPRP